MTIKNYFVNAFKIDRESFELIESIAEITGFEKQKIIRWLLNTSLQLLRERIQEAKGIQNIEFNVKEIQKINM